MMIGLHGMVGAIVALDGMPLLVPEVTDQAILGSAQRADFILDVTSDLDDQAIIAIYEGDEAFILSHFDIVGTNARVAREAVSALPPNLLTPMARIVDARESKLHMEGGAMCRLRHGTWKGEDMSLRELANNGQIWTFNGVAGLPETPLIELSQGEVLRIPMQNDTAFPHAMHLHGHHFQEEMPDGSLGPLRDTFLMDCGETRTIVFRADNPGDWLLHCHMLSHQAVGMKTWLRVTT